MSYRVDHFSGADDAGRLAEVQRLRYGVYHAELGFDPPGMDHLERRDRTPHDRVSELFCAWCDDTLVGTLRLQAPGAIALSAEDEFELALPSVCVAEGARFAVRPEHRDGPASLLLFDAFRRWCRAHSIDTVVSIVMVPDPARDRAIANAALAWAARRVRFDWSSARPRPAFECGGFEPPGASEVEPPVFPPMLRLLASSRTTSRAAPGYCADYRAWSLLFTTELSGGAR